MCKRGRGAKATKFTRSTALGLSESGYDHAIKCLTGYSAKVSNFELTYRVLYSLHMKYVVACRAGFHSAAPG